MFTRGGITSVYMRQWTRSTLAQICQNGSHFVQGRWRITGHKKWPSTAFTAMQRPRLNHYNDVTMDSIASQITSLTIVYSAVYSGADQRKHQSSASLAFVRGIHRGPVNSPHKWPVTRKMFPFDDVIMTTGILQMTFFQWIFLHENCYILIQISPRAQLTINQHWFR